MMLQIRQVIYRAFKQRRYGNKVLKGLFIVCWLMYSFKVTAQPSNFFKTVKVSDSLSLPMPSSYLSKEANALKAKKWTEVYRPEVLARFRSSVYGDFNMDAYRYELFKVDEGSTDLYNRVQYRLRVFKKSTGDMKVSALVAVFLPRTELKGLIVGLNFYGNHTVTIDPRIFVNKDIHSGWNASLGIEGFRQTEDSRGARQHRWPIHLITDKGYGLVTACYEEFYPDALPGSAGYIESGFVGDSGSLTNAEPVAAIASWAAGMRYMAAALRKLAGYQVPFYAVGHSRLGKTALWAAAQDTIFKGVLVNGAGRGGSSLMARDKGETIVEINQKFPHWFNAAFMVFGNGKTPDIDQHLLMAAVTPRKLMVASASADLPADPVGEFLAVRYAAEIYTWLRPDLQPFEQIMPKPDKFAGNALLRYHYRRGVHDITYMEWKSFLNFIE